MCISFEIDGAQNCSCMCMCMCTEFVIQALKQKNAHVYFPAGVVPTYLPTYLPTSRIGCITSIRKLSELDKSNES